MGKVAVLDAGLENFIDITRHQKPSACIYSLLETSDLVCLLNRGKTLETGKVFGEIVASLASRAGNKTPYPDRKP